MADDPDQFPPAPIPPFLRSERPATAAEDGLQQDDALPVASRIVRPGRGGGLETPYAADPQPDDGGPTHERRRDRLQRLVHDVVDLALDDALDRLRPELHARLRDYLEQRLPDLIDEALRAAEQRPGPRDD